MQIIKFHTLNKVEISSKVKDINTTQDLQDNKVFRIILNLLHADFQKIVDNSWFNYFPTVRNDAPLENFDVNVSLDLQLILRPELSNLLKDKSSNEVLELLKTADKNYAFLNCSESWIVFRVLQKIPIPQHLQSEKASLKVGYNTRFAAIPSETKNSVQDALEVYLAQRQKPFEDLSDGLFRTEVETPTNSWVVLFLAESKENKCVIYSVLPTPTPEEKRADMATILIHINYSLGIGAFEMDMSDGEIRFRTSIDVSNSNLSLELLDNLFKINIKTTNAHINRLISRM